MTWSHGLGLGWEGGYGRKTNSKTEEIKGREGMGIKVGRNGRWNGLSDVAEIQRTLEIISQGL